MTSNKLTNRISNPYASTLFHTIVTHNHVYLNDDLNRLPLVPSRDSNHEAIAPYSSVRTSSRPSRLVSARGLTDFATQ